MTSSNKPATIQLRAYFMLILPPHLASMGRTRSASGLLKMASEFVIPCSFQLASAATGSPDSSRIGCPKSAM